MLTLTAFVLNDLGNRDLALLLVEKLATLTDRRALVALGLLYDALVAFNIKAEIFKTILSTAKRIGLVSLVAPHLGKLDLAMEKWENFTSDQRLGLYWEAIESDIQNSLAIQLLLKYVEETECSDSKTAEKVLEKLLRLAVPAEFVKYLTLPILESLEGLSKELVSVIQTGNA